MSARARVAVIGGGIVGLCCARELARAGNEVELFERRRLGSGSTGASAGNVHAQLEHRMLAEGERWPEHALRARLRAVMPAVEAWERLAHDLELALPPRQGGLVVAESEREIRALEERVAIESRWGLPTVLLDAGEAARAVGGLAPGIRAAAYSPVEGFVDVAEVVRALASDALAHGASLTAGTRCALGAEEASVLVGDAATAERFDAVIAACGPFSRELDRTLNGEAVPVALSLLRCPSPHGGPQALIQHAGKRLSLKRLPNGDLVIGGGLAAALVLDRGRVTGAVTVDEQTVRSAIDAANGVLARPIDPGEVTILGGVAGLSFCRAPILARELASRPGTFVALAEQGITHAPLVGRRIADLVAGLPAATSAAATVAGP